MYNKKEQYLLAKELAQLSIETSKEG